MSNFCKISAAKRLLFAIRIQTRLGTLSLHLSRLRIPPFYHELHIAALCCHGDECNCCGFFLPRDATRKRGLCCLPVSICQSVCHVGVLYPDGWRYRQTSLSAR